jgi:SAM-dependent methyltransferase
MGRWSRPLAEAFVRWLKPSPGGHWLDVGTGTGALATAICNLAQPSTVVACDASRTFVESARRGLVDARVLFEVAGVGDLPLREGGYDAIVSGLALNFFPDPRAALEEQLNAVGPAGLVGAYLWDYADGMEFLRYFWDAAIAVEPSAAEMDEGHRFPLCRPGALERLFDSVGAGQIRATPLRVPTLFSSFDDYWRPFLGGTGPAPSLVAGFSEQQRRELEAELRSRLPMQDSGRIALEARAWAVVGQRSRS